MQPLVPEREPALALGGKIEQDVLEPAKGAATVESDLQPVAKPHIAHHPGELCHPPILDLRAQRLDVDQASCGQPGVDLAIRRPVVVIVQAVHGYHPDLAALQVQIAGPLAVIRGQRHLEVTPIHRDSFSSTRRVEVRLDPAASESSLARPLGTRARRSARTEPGAPRPATRTGPEPVPKRGPGSARSRPSSSPSSGAPRASARGASPGTSASPRAACQSPSASR